MIWINPIMVRIRCLLLALCVLTTDITCRRIVDLSYDLHHNSMTYPVNPKFNLTIVHSGPFGKTPWVEFGNVEFGEHTGTHVDAPVHFYKAGRRAHQVPIEQLFGPGVVINVKNQVARNIDYRVTAQDLMNWEKEHGKIPKGAYILMNSGWGKRYDDWNRVYNSSNLKDFGSFHFPSFHENAAEWLVNNRDIHGIGVDTPSTDYGPSDSQPVHQIISKEEILMIENIANMDKLPPSGADIYLPMIKFRDGTGAPARMFAIIEDDGDRATYNSGTMTSFSSRPCMVLGVLSFLLCYLSDF